jgi:hypothetical protein
MFWQDAGVDAAADAAGSSAGAEAFEFQAETNRLMDIIINSLYKSKEVSASMLASAFACRTLDIYRACFATARSFVCMQHSE